MTAETCVRGDLHQDHGIFFAADTREEIDALAENVMDVLNGALTRRPEGFAAPLGIPFRSPGGRHVIPFDSPVLDGFLASREAFAPLCKPFTPDHQVYCGADPLFLDNILDIDFDSPHKIIAVRELGCFACGDGEKAAASARDLFLDAAAIAIYAGNFGGYRHMSDELIEFIANWEVERYRVNQSTQQHEEVFLGKNNGGILWDNRFCMGCQEVDDQHRGLFAFVGELLDQCFEGSSVEKLNDALDVLVEYAVNHFRDEEAVQLRCGFPDYAQHKSQHEDFALVVVDLVHRFSLHGSSEELSRDVNAIVVDWLIHHICEEDSKIGKHMQGAASPAGT